MGFDDSRDYQDFATAYGVDINFDNPADFFTFLAGLLTHMDDPTMTEEISITQRISVSRLYNKSLSLFRSLALFQGILNLEIDLLEKKWITDVYVLRYKSTARQHAFYVEALNKIPGVKTLIGQ